MSYQVLARKWRPRVFEDVVGQAHVVRALANALESGRLHHAFLFTGTRGVGKTTIARILAKCLNCERGVGPRPCGECSACREVDEGRYVDLLEVDAASRTRVEDTRDLLENVPYAPTRGRYKVYLIDEVHMLSTHSFNALLKTLEEPPDHVKFLLATTDPQRLPATILSRCLQFSLKRLPAERITEHLVRVTAAEGVPAEAAALRRLAAAADGSVRDALSVLDQAIAFSGGRITEASVREMLGTLDRGALVGVLEAVAAGDGAAVLRRAAELADQSPDLDGVLAGIAALAHAVSVVQVVGDLPGDPGDLAEQVRGLAARVSPEDAQLYYQIALVGRRDLPLAPDPLTGLEMTLLRMVAFRPAVAGRVEPPPPLAADSRPTPSVPAPRAAEVGPGPDAGARPEGWPEVVERLGLVGLARELALNCVLLGRDAETIRLALAPSHAQMRGKARERQLEEALASFYGSPLRLVLEVGEAAGETPAQAAQRQAEERRNAAARVLSDDPTVQRLQDVFGATVVEESVRASGEGR